MTAFDPETVSRLVHELRTPLSSLRLLGELLEANPAGHLEAKELAQARNVQQIVADLTALLDEMGELARLRSARPHVESHVVHLDELLRWTEQELEKQAGGHGLKLAVACDEAAPQTLHSDGKRLQRTIGLLLASAARATTEGAIDVRFAPASTTLLAGTPIAPQGALQIAITDTGVSVDEAAREAVFTPLFAHRRNARCHGGIKLTLPLARALARHLDGELLLTSQEPETTLTLLLPAAPRT